MEHLGEGITTAITFFVAQLVDKVTEPNPNDSERWKQIKQSLRNGQKNIGDNEAYHLLVSARTHMHNAIDILSDRYERDQVTSSASQGEVMNNDILEKIYISNSLFENQQSTVLLHQSLVNCFFEAEKTVMKYFLNKDFTYNAELRIEALRWAIYSRLLQKLVINKSLGMGVEAEYWINLIMEDDKLLNALEAGLESLAITISNKDAEIKKDEEIVDPKDNDAEQLLADGKTNLEDRASWCWRFSRKKKIKNNKNSSNAEMKKDKQSGVEIKNNKKSDVEMGLKIFDLIEELQSLSKKRVDEEYEKYEKFLTDAFVNANKEKKRYLILKFNRKKEEEKLKPLLERLKNSNRKNLVDIGFDLMAAQLRQLYQKKFQTYNPFNFILPYDFHMNESWVPLTLEKKGAEQDKMTQNGKVTEDSLQEIYDKIMESALELNDRSKENGKKLLTIVTGEPFTGKTTLMQKIAYDWATKRPNKAGDIVFAKYDLILITPLRDVPERRIPYDKILDMSIAYIQEFSGANFEYLNRANLEKRNILILVDGYDEERNSLCTEFYKVLQQDDDLNLETDVLVTSRPSREIKRKESANFLKITGFSTDNQKKIYIQRHLRKSKDKLKTLLKSSIGANFEETGILENNKKMKEIFCKLLRSIIFHYDNDDNLDETAYLERMTDDHTLHAELKKALNSSKFIDELVKLAVSEKWSSFFSPSTEIKLLVTDFLAIINEHPETKQLLSIIKQNQEMKELINERKELLKIIKRNRNLYDMTKAPMILTFTCLVHEELKHANVIQEKENQGWAVTELFDMTIKLILKRWSEQQRNNSQTYQEMQLETDNWKSKKIFHELGYFAFVMLVRQKYEFTTEDFNEYDVNFTYFLNNGLLFADTQMNALNLNLKCQFVHRTFQEYLAALYVVHWTNREKDDGDVSGQLLAHNEVKYELRDLIKMIFDLIMTERNDQSLKSLKKLLEKITHNMGFPFCFQLKQNAKEEFNYLKKVLKFCTSLKHLAINGNEADIEFSLTELLLRKLKIKEISLHAFKINSEISLEEMFKLQFKECTFEANSQLSFTKCLSLKNLQFDKCVINSSTNVGFKTLSTINTVEFDNCKFDLATWQSITDDIRNISIQCLKLSFGEGFNKEFLIHLQKCNTVEKMEISIQNYKIYQTDLLLFNDFTKLHSFTCDECIFEVESKLSFGNWSSLAILVFNHCQFGSGTVVSIETLSAIATLSFKACTFEANSQLSFTNCLSLKNLEFKECKTESNTIVCIASLPAIAHMAFNDCAFEANSQLFLTNCSSVNNVIFNRCQIGSSAIVSIATLPAILHANFNYCVFEANSQLSFTNCSSQKQLQINDCQFRGSTIIGIAILPAIDVVQFHHCEFEDNSQLFVTNCSPGIKVKLNLCPASKLRIFGSAFPAMDPVEFRERKTDLAQWQSITDAIRDSSVKSLKLSADYFVKDTYLEFLHHLQKCKCIEEILVEDHVLSENDSAYIFNRYEEKVTANLVQTAQKLPGLTSITISDRYGKKLDECRRLNERNKERIEKAGQERNPAFLIKYVK